MLLIRHAAVEIDPTVNSTNWVLSENGRSLSKSLAHQLLKQKPDRVLTSTEPKAIETGQLMAHEWQVPCQTWSNLHEHERAKNEFVGDRTRWLAMVAQFLATPNDLVFGVETAVQAAKRFETAIQSAQAKFPNENLAFVSHGRILTAFLSQHNPQIEPVTFWQRLKMPDAILVQPGAYKLMNALD